eukprot:m.453263 g.453263  ORF g.453263 m.453263 type:complete len:269 (+) comp56933_c0_seq2:126-932(+)
MSGRVGVFGCGQMGQALIGGMLASGAVSAADLIAADPNEAATTALRQKHGITTTHTPNEVAKFAHVLIVAVKPHDVPSLLEDIKSALTPDHLLISIAAGISITTMEAIVGKMRIVRVMPNTPALVQAGASAFSPNSAATAADAELVNKLFSSVGLCFQLPESKLDAVTGLSGSGPAYVFIMIEALADGGVKMGIPRNIALKLAAQTVYGAAKMVLDTETHPAVLKDQVCSPEGTTISAVHALEKGGVRSALIGAVEAATLRSKELKSA